jgi:hypothetical protein
MIAKLQKFVNKISINISLLINIIGGRGFSGNIGLNHEGLCYFLGVLSGRRRALAYCRKEARRGLKPFPLMINKQGVWDNDR